MKACSSLFQILEKLKLNREMVRNLFSDWLAVVEDGISVVVVLVVENLPGAGDDVVLNLTRENNVIVRANCARHGCIVVKRDEPRVSPGGKERQILGITDVVAVSVKITSDDDVIERWMAVSKIVLDILQVIDLVFCVHVGHSSDWLQMGRDDSDFLSFEIWRILACSFQNKNCWWSLEPSGCGVVEIVTIDLGKIVEIDLFLINIP